MTCKNCGFENENPTGFCGNCGAPFGGEDVLENTEPASEAAETVEAAEVENNEAAVLDEAPKKGWRPKKWMIITASVVVALAVLLGVFWRPIVNTLMYILPAKTHLKWAISNTTNDLSGNVGGIYDKIYSSLLDGTGMESSAEIKLDSTAKSFIKQNLGMDLEFETITVNSVASLSDDGEFGMSAEIALEDETIITGEVAFSYEEKLLSLSVPELSEEALTLDLETLIDGETLDVLAEIELSSVYSTLEDILPDSKLITNLLTKYSKVAIDSVETIERSSGEYEIGNVTADATCFEVEISEETAYNMVLAVLNELKDDDDIKGYIEDVCKSLKSFATDMELDALEALADIDEEDALDAYVEAIESILDRLDDAKVDDEPVAVVYVYINGSGEIIAVDVALETEGSDNRGFILGTAEADGEVAIGAYLCNNDKYQGILCEGEGSTSSFKGDLLMLDGKLDDAESVAELIDFDFDSLAEGYINGSINLASGVLNLPVEMTFETDSDSSKATYNIPGILSYTVTTELTSAKSFDVIADGNDDPADWAKNIDADEILDKLSEYGIDLSKLEKLNLGSLMGGYGSKVDMESVDGLTEETPEPDYDYDYDSDMSGEEYYGDYDAEYDGDYSLAEEEYLY